MHKVERRYDFDRWVLEDDAWQRRKFPATVAQRVKK